MREISIVICLITLIGCAGTSNTYTEPDTGPYVQKDNCIEPGNCLRDGDTPTPPGYVKNPSAPKNTPLVYEHYYSIPHQTPLAPPPMPLYPQTYRYSGVQDGKYHWGRITVDPDGSYSGFDNEGGFFRGRMEAQ